MIHRREYIENSLLLSNAGTHTMDLNFVDPLTSIELIFNATNGNAHNAENPLLHNITKIEIVDGGDVITSIRGEVLRGLISHIEGRIPGALQTEIQNDTVKESVTIPFGRFFLDTTYAFNPVAFRNPQFKLTWDLEHIRDVGNDAYVTDTLYLTAIANIMEGVGAPTGVLTAKEVYDFSSAAAGDEKVKLPTDYPIRTLGIRAYENGVYIADTVSNLKLSADGGKVLLFDEETWDLLNRQFGYYGELVNTRVCRFTNAQYVAMYMPYVKGGNVAKNISTAHILAVGYFYNSDAIMWAHNHSGEAIDWTNAFITARGTGYENCIMIPFGRLNDPETWLDAMRFGSLNLFITQKEAGGEVQVFVQEARPY